MQVQGLFHNWLPSRDTYKNDHGVHEGSTYFSKFPSWGYSGNTGAYLIGIGFWVKWTEESFGVYYVVIIQGVRLTG